MVVWPVGTTGELVSVDLIAVSLGHCSALNSPLPSALIGSPTRGAFVNVNVPQTVPTSASVVIIGGGIMGTATAYELAKAGVEDIVLIERGELAGGSTSRAAGGLRCQFSDEANIMLGARSLEIFRRFEEQMGQNIDMVQSGYLFLLDNEADAEKMAANVELQASLGQSSRMISPAECGELNPVIRTDDLVAGAFNPFDAHCTPEAAVAGYAKNARRLGVTILRGVEVTRVIAEGDEAEPGSRRITGVETSAGPIAADTVVCAAGAWSKKIGADVGIDLPVEPLRRHIVVSEPVNFDPRRLPFTIDFSTSYYFHSEGAGLLLGAPEVEDTWGFSTQQDPAWLEVLAELMERRTPMLDDVQLRRGWAGLYEITPDHNALIGKSSQVDGFLYATGFSGHGFLQGPAVGEIMADLYLDRTPLIDISGLSLDRFASGEVRKEMNVV